MIAKSLPATILQTEGYALFEYKGSGVFRPIGCPPSWWDEVHDRTTGPEDSERLGQRFPFIENFLIDAQEFWLSKSSGCVRSGIWIERGENGREMPLESSALWIGGKRVLLIREIPLDIYQEHHELFQTTRQACLDHA